MTKAMARREIEQQIAALTIKLAGLNAPRVPMPDGCIIRVSVSAYGGDPVTISEIDRHVRCGCAPQSTTGDDERDGDAPEAMLAANGKR